MKIIGKTDGGYLVEASAYELSLLSEGKAAERAQSYSYDPRPIPMGTTFEVTKVIEHMHALNRAAKDARSGAHFMRGLADILDKGIPEWIAEPPKPEEPVKDEGVFP